MNAAAIRAELGQATNLDAEARRNRERVGMLLREAGGICDVSSFRQGRRHRLAAARAADADGAAESFCCILTRKYYARDDIGSASPDGPSRSGVSRSTAG